MQKTGYTEKPSDRFKKIKAADPFAGGKKHKTNFGYVYSSGGVPIRINHGTVRNTIQWDKQPQGRLSPLLTHTLTLTLLMHFYRIGLRPTAGELL